MGSLSRLLLLALTALPFAAQAQAPFVLRAQQGDNLTQVANGSTVTFSSSSPGTPRTIQILVTYSGTGSVTFPSGISTLGSPAFTAQLTSGNGALTPFQTATVEVVYTPTGTDSVSGELDIGYLEVSSSGAQAQRGLLTLGLSGGVPVYSLSYSTSSGGNVTALAPGGTLLFPDTLVNTTTVVPVSVVNLGGSAGKVVSVSLSGGTFAIAGLPALPLTLSPAAALAFQLTYLPRQTGGGTATLTIGLDGGVTQQYQLQGLSIVSQVAYEIVQTTGAIPLPAGQQIQFPETASGSSSQFQIRLTNTSSTDFVLSGATTTGAPFGFTNLPLLPATLAPAASVTLGASFAPLQVGQFSGSIRIGSDTFPVAGTGTGLPGYTLTGPTQVAALDQPAVTLTLSQAYPVNLTGVLTLAVASDYAPDPAVQFSSGGRTVAFTIAANSTAAVFSNGSSTVRLQTGSVASAFTLTPSFATEQGVDVTPASPTTLKFAMPASAPSLLGVQVASQTNTGLTLRLLGVATTRSLTSTTIRFTGATGFNLPNLNFTLDLTGPSSLWFNSAASQSFGGQFTLDIPFVLATSDTGTGATAPVLALQSVSATISNASGDSNATSLTLR
ncbi:MAG: hypothetical protein ABI693_03405 [Bryobacteraceae bacterium]